MLFLYQFYLQELVLLQIICITLSTTSLDFALSSTQWVKYIFMHMCFDDLFRRNSYYNSMKIEKLIKNKEIRILLQKFVDPIVNMACTNTICFLFQLNMVQKNAHFVGLGSTFFMQFWLTLNPQAWEKSWSGREHHQLERAIKEVKSFEATFFCRLPAHVKQKEI